MLLFWLLVCYIEARPLVSSSKLVVKSSGQTEYLTRFPNVTWNNDARRLTTSKLDQGHYQSRAPIANGYLGIAVAAVGPFFEYDTPVDGDNINGWPLFDRRQTFATIRGFFDEQPTTNGTNFEWLNQYGGESVISGVPHWSGLVVDLGNGQYLDASVDGCTISNFSSSIDCRSGVVAWQYTWSPLDSGNISFDITYTMFTHKLLVNQAFVQLEIQPSSDYDVSVVNVMDGTSAVRTSFIEKGAENNQIYTAVSPSNVLNASAYTYATMAGSPGVNMSTLVTIDNETYLGTNDSSIAQSVKVTLKCGKTTTITKFIGGASSDAFADPRETAKNASLAAMSTGFEKSLEAHSKEWATVLSDESLTSYEDNGSLPSNPEILESAIAATVSKFYLLMNTLSQNAARVNNLLELAWSISVGGLTSESYAGMIFWDAETWMMPDLVASHPYEAMQIVSYRVARYAQALANAQTAYESSKSQTSFSSNAAIYPWTSGRYGNCTGTGPCFDYEYHINGDIAQAFTNFWATTGDTTYLRSSLFPIHDSISTMFSELLSKNVTDGETFYTLTNMTDPDEYANHIDNGGYTMPLIQDTLFTNNALRGILGLPINETYAEIASYIYISRDAGADIIDEYTGMNGTIGVKQADVTLVTYPLNHQDNYTLENSRHDLDYYAGKQVTTGPGMTYGDFSIVDSEVAVGGCAAWTYQLYSEIPYAREPWFQFSEQLTDDFKTNGGTHPAFPFLTGHGGALQVPKFGYLGYRMTVDYILHIDPSLPPQIPVFKPGNFYWQGWPISAMMNRSHTTLTRLSVPYTGANQTYVNSSIPVMVKVGNNQTLYQLPPNGTLTISTRDIADTIIIPRNIAQCLPVNSTDDYQPGQFPLSAVDGASSTQWQPSHANRSASLTISLLSQPFQLVTGFFFDWAQAPPVNFTVTFHNSSEIGTMAITAASVVDIAVSESYNQTTANITVPYRSNTTNVTLQEPVYSGRYATLTIIGNQANKNANASGATVAEWAIIGSVRQTLPVSYYA